MAIAKVIHADYTGASGVEQVRILQQALTEALAQENWALVRRLDTSCMCLIDKVISANKGDAKSLLAALSELKGVYSSLIVRCQCEVAAIAH